MSADFKIVFAGSPEFSVVILNALYKANYTITAVLTQPDRPAGRGKKLSKSPVKVFAEQHHLPIDQPATLRDPATQERIRQYQPDLMVVVAYGLLLPQAVLDIPRYGCINVHPSLLPRWRGAAPIQRAILAGDTETGVTIMQMEKGLDSGPMLHRVKSPIHLNDTSATMHDRLAKLGAEALIKTIEDIKQHRVHPEIQNHDLANYAEKIVKEEANINWQRSAQELDQQIRAFNPWPGACTLLNENSVKIWQASIQPERSKALPGTIIYVSNEGIDVATGNGVLRLTTLQFPGGKPLSVQEILNSKRDLFAVGKSFN